MTPVAPIRGPAAPSGARQVEPRRTPAAPSQIRAAIAGAYARQTGSAAPPALLDVLTAHVSHETARGERMFNHNFGGIKATGGPGAVARYATRELDAAGGEHHLVDGFRAYGSLAEGAADYVATMRERFGAALPAAARGDADGFAAALKQRGYFTAHLEDYASSMRSLSRDATATGRVHTAASASVPAPDAVPSLGSLGALPGAFGALPGAPSAAMDLPTVDTVARILDAVAAMTAKVGAPLGDPSDRKL
jgi:flagellar protein FlgJ